MLILAIKLIDVNLDGLVGVSAVFRGAERANERVLMALTVEADKIHFFPVMPLLRALYILYDVTGDLLLHCQRFITFKI